MAKKLLTIEVRGNRSKWCFEVMADPQHLAEWQADGLKIYMVENTAPLWIANAGLSRAWCFMQDVFNFRNPWRS